MNVNNFYKELFEDRLGLDILGLESRYKDLVRLINRTTLTTFANYIPCTYCHYLDLTDTSNLIKEDLARAGREYYIKDDILDKFNLPILAIKRVELMGANNADPEIEGYYSTIIASRQNIDLESAILGSEYTYLDTMINNSIPFKRVHELRGSRLLYLRNYPLTGIVEVRVTTKYPNLASIPEEYREALIDLAKLDIKIKLYNELKYIEDVVTPVGNLNLKISDWDNAERERVDFIKDLRARSFPDRINTSYFYVM